MVSPLFVGIFGYLIFFTLIRAGLLYLSRSQSKLIRLDQRLYIKALNEYYKNPENSSVKNAVYFFGNQFYSHEFGEVDKKSILNMILNDLDNSKSFEMRNQLIAKDLSGKKLAA